MFPKEHNSDRGHRCQQEYRSKKKEKKNGKYDAGKPGKKRIHQLRFEGSKYLQFHPCDLCLRMRGSDHLIQLVEVQKHIAKSIHRKSLLLFVQ